MAGYSPGWNDPPPLGFSPCTQPGGKRTLLNKRVPFPLNQSTLTPQPGVQSCNNGTLNTSSSNITNYDITSSSNSSSLQEEASQDSKIEIPDEEILPFVICTFEKILSENSHELEKKRIDEINQRINIMKESWDAKTSIPVKHKMFNLAQELSKGSADLALKIQCVLMVDYLREVKHWMVGVKHIIEMERQKSSSASESSDATY